MQFNFIRQVNIKRRQILKTSFDIYFKISGDKKVAELFLNETTNSIVIGDKEFSIENISRHFGPEKYQVRDSDSKQIIAGIKINGWGANPFWKDAASDPNAQITLDKVVYNFRNITSWQALGLFKKKRTKNFSFKLYSVYGNESLDFQVALEIPNLRAMNYFASVPLSGSIESNISFNILYLIGLFLIQKSFENEGKESS